MNWLTKAISLGEKIKKVLRKRPSKEEIENSDWTSCCKGPVLKKDLENNLWVCHSCGKHHRISCRQRFDIFFGKNSYEIIETPQPSDDPLNWVDTKSYKDRLKSARKKTGLKCSMIVATGLINNIKTTAVASDFDFLGASIEAAEGEVILFATQYSIENKTPLIICTSGGGMRMQASMISLSQMPRTILAINELKKNRDLSKSQANDSANMADEIKKLNDENIGLLHKLEELKQKNNKLKGANQEVETRISEMIKMYRNFLK